MKGDDKMIWFEDVGKVLKIADEIVCNIIKLYQLDAIELEYAKKVISEMWMIQEKYVERYLKQCLEKEEGEG